MACRYGIAVGLLTVRPGRYGKDRRAGRSDAGQVSKGDTAARWPNSGPLDPKMASKISLGLILTIIGKNWPKNL